MLDCLTTGGAVASFIGDSSSQTIEFPQGLDGDALWAGCIQSGQADIASFIGVHATCTTETEFVETANTEAAVLVTADITTDPNAVPIDTTPVGCSDNTDAAQPSDTPDGVASRYGIDIATSRSINPDLTTPQQLGHLIVLPCQVHINRQSTDGSGLDAVTALATVRSTTADPTFVVTNSVTVAIASEVCADRWIGVSHRRVQRGRGISAVRLRP